MATHHPGIAEGLLAHLHQLDLSSVFMIVGDTDTPEYPQLFNAVNFESQRLTEDGANVDPSHSLRQSDLRMSEPRDRHPTFSLYTVLACHRMMRGWYSDMIAKDFHRFCISLRRDSLDVAVQVSNRRWSSARRLRASAVTWFQQAWRHSRCVAELGCAVFFLPFFRHFLRSTRQVERFAACSF